MKSAGLSLLEHSRPVQVCTGIALPFLFSLWHIRWKKVAQSQSLSACFNPSLSFYQFFTLIHLSYDVWTICPPEIWSYRPTATKGTLTTNRIFILASFTRDVHIAVCSVSLGTFTANLCTETTQKVLTLVVFLLDMA